MTQHYWTGEEDNWLKDNFYPYIDRTEMLSNFNSNFNTNITINSLNQRLYKYRLLTPNSDYTPEMEQWLIANYDLSHKTAQEMADEFNAVFGTHKTKSSIWHKAFRLTNQRLSDEPRTRLDYTPEMIERIKEIVPLWSYKKCAEMMTEEFGYKFTSSMIEHKANRLGIKKPNNGFNNLDPRLPSINWFMKGRPSLNTKPVGTETVMTDKNGRVSVAVKIADNEWEYKHRLIYKQHYGEIPENGYIIFADGNQLNFDIDNLVLVSRAEHAVMNRKNLRFNDTDLTKTGLNIAKLIIAKNKRRTKNEKHTS
jgi:hypothetical protein